MVPSSGLGRRSGAGLLGGVGGWSVWSTLLVLDSGGYRGELTDSSVASRRFSGLSSKGNGCGTLCRRPSQVTAGPTRESRLASFSALEYCVRRALIPAGRPNAACRFEVILSTKACGRFYFPPLGLPFHRTHSFPFLGRCVFSPTPPILHTLPTSSLHSTHPQSLLFKNKTKCKYY